MDDLEAWKALPDNKKTSQVSTNYAPMSAAEFKKNHDGSLDAMNEAQLNATNGIPGLTHATQVLVAKVQIPHSKK